MFLRNHWYVAATDQEIGRKPFRRIILERTRGDVSHRGRHADRAGGSLPAPAPAVVDGQAGRRRRAAMPLSRPALRPTGAVRARAGPGHDPADRAGESYPVVERYKWLWIWMGDPALADPAKIADYHWLDDPNWGAKKDYLHAQCNWQLVNDNLLDLTHLAFVHETTIGNMALVEHAAVRVQRTPDGVQVTRWIIDQPAPPAFVKIGGFTGNVDRWQIIDYLPPSFIRLDVGATPTGTGAPEGKRVNGIQMRNLNAMTPETETTTHYFWAQAHDFEPRNPDMTARVFAQIKTAFLRGRRGVHRAAGEHRARSRRAADRHQRRLGRHPGPPHRRPALPGRAGGASRAGHRGGVRLLGAFGTARKRGTDHINRSESVKRREWLRLRRCRRSFRGAIALWLDAESNDRS